MESYLLKLLEENNRIIIPDFGAFIMKQKSPRKVIFNEFLQYNDGALIDAVSKGENLERDKAASKVSEYVKELHHKLSSENNYSINGIGKLVRSSTGKISLEEISEKTAETKPPVSEDKPIEDAPLEIETETQDKEKQVTQAKSEVATPKSTPEPEPVPTPKPKATEKEKPAEPIQKDATPKAKPAEPVQKKAAPRAEPVTKPRPVIQRPTIESQKPKVTPPVKTTEKKPAKPAGNFYAEEKKSNKSKMVIWIVAIVLINGIIVSYWIFNKEIKAFFAGQRANETEILEPIDDSDQITDDSETLTQDPAEDIYLEEQTIEDDPEEAEPTQKIIAGKKYYVVAGVFENENNADNLVSELKAQGYNNAEKFGKIGVLHAVCYDVFPSKQEADRLMLKLKNDMDPDVWVKVVN